MNDKGFPTSEEEILADPHRFGLPTFEEYRKMRSKILPREDRYLTAISDGPQNFRKDLKKIRYFVHGNPLSGEEAVEKMLLDHGYTLEDIDLEGKVGRLAKTIQLVDVGGGLEHEVHVNFLP